MHFSVTVSAICRDMLFNYDAWSMWFVTATVTTNFGCRDSEVRRWITEKLNNVAKAAKRDPSEADK